jgi:VWFA-related protein
MTGGRATSRTAVAALLACAGAAFSLDAQQPAGQTGAFRSRITVVPLDVRVLDRDGKPVTDLTQRDFTVREDGVDQTISYFSAQGLTPEAPDTSATPLPLRTPAGDLKAQNRRVFLIMLGRGRMTGPTREIPGLVEFLNKGLLPQDHVALLAYNRATDFTTDRAALLGVVERYRSRHEKIEALLAQHFSGLRAVYGSKEMPDGIQQEIDAVFAGASALRPRAIRPGQITDDTQLARDVRQTADALQLAEARAGRENVLTDLGESAAAGRAFDMTFDEYIADQIELNQDLGNLYAGIDYLRHIDGEKHLVFLTPRGVLMPRVENDRSLGAAAADARVVMDVIFTGGTLGSAPPRMGGTAVAPIPSIGASFAQSFNFQALRSISELTGGQTTTTEYVNRAFGRIDTSSRFQYLLGYAPTNTRIDGKLRNVTVSVNRPGVTVHYRRGYFASAQLIPLDRRQFVTHNRIVSAGRYTGVIKDIEAGIVSAGYTAETGELAIQLTIRSPRVSFAEADAEGRRTATLDLAIYCGDQRQRVSCEATQRLDLTLGAEAHKLFATKGTTMTARIRASSPPAHVKVIVYDYAADVLGTAVWKK